MTAASDSPDGAKGVAEQHPPPAPAGPQPGSGRQNRQRAGFEADQSQSHDPAGSASAWGAELPPHDQDQSPDDVHDLDSRPEGVHGLDAPDEGTSDPRHPHLRYEDVGQPSRLPSPAALWRYLRELDSLVNFHPKNVAVPPRQSVGWRGDLMKPPKE